MKKSITLITLPYDSAHFNERMGAGPLHIINNQLIQNLQASGHDVYYKQIILEDAFPTEVASAFQLLKQVKAEVAKAIQNKSFPIMLSGNCCATVGVLAGINTSNTGVIWFDAHGDCETPETTLSGFFDGMGLSMLLNSCWQNLISSFKLNTSLTGKNIVVVGARDLSMFEQEFISDKEINHITVNAVKHSKGDIIKSSCSELINTGIQKIHLHIDFDVIDPSVARANSYSVKNGLDKEELLDVINFYMSKLPVTSLTIASYDPSYDTNNCMRGIIHEVIETIIKQNLASPPRPATPYTQTCVS